MRPNFPARNFPGHDHRHVIHRASNETTSTSSFLTSDDYDSLAAAGDEFFILVMGLFVMVMQLGFAFVEVGLVQSRNSVSVLMKNFLDATIGVIVYWASGYAISYGAGNEFMGWHKFFFIGLENGEMVGVFFQYTFAAAAATIVSGTLAERAKLAAYITYSCALTGIVYPVVVHWQWSSEGWLYNRGFMDFAGSGVVHTVGGTAALVGSIFLGARLGRFPPTKGEDETSPPSRAGGGLIRTQSFFYQIGGRKRSLVKVLPRHSIPFFVLGCFIQWVTFLCFNGGSQLRLFPEAVRDDDGNVVEVINHAWVVADIFWNTIMSGSGGCLSTLLAIWGYNRKWDAVSVLSGCLAGMVAICGGANQMDVWAAFTVGVVAGGVMVLWSKTLEFFRIDDPVEAVPVHLGCGVWGVLAVGIFGRDAGLIYTGNLEQFGIQFWGVLAIFGWVAAAMAPIYAILKYLDALRVDIEHERAGMDMVKHGEEAYNFADTTTVRNLQKATKTLIQSQRQLQRRATKGEENKRRRGSVWSLLGSSPFVRRVSAALGHGSSVKEEEDAEGGQVEPDLEEAERQIDPSPQNMSPRTAQRHDARHMSHGSSNLRGKEEDEEESDDDEEEEEGNGDDDAEENPASETLQKPSLSSDAKVPMIALSRPALPRPSLRGASSPSRNPRTRLSFRETRDGGAILGVLEGIPEKEKGAEIHKEKKKEKGEWADAPDAQFEIPPSEGSLELRPPR